MNIKYIKGDATNPVGDDNKLICHICNDIGAWGGGFVLGVTKRSTKPEGEYRKWCKNGQYKDGGEYVPFKQGQIQIVGVGDKTFVCNMIAQSGCGHFEGLPPIRYGSLEECLLRVRTRVVRSIARGIPVSLHMPRIGCGLAGGTWDLIEQVITDVFKDVQVDITVYDVG